MNRKKITGFAAALAVCVGLVGTSVITSAADTEEQNSLVESQEISDTEDEVNEIIEELGGENTDTGDMTIQEVVKKTMPAMVSITNTSVEEIQNYFNGDPFDFFFGYGGYGYGGRGNYYMEPQTRESVSAGSGVIIGMTDDSILIATNEHVVSGADELSVAFSDDTAAPAENIGTDKSHDLAVIKVAKDDVEPETLDAIAVIPFGSSSDLEVGETVVAIGNALGYGQSVSAGIVSALNRTITTGDYMTGRYDQSEGMIQTDASINPGNSGGALLNLKGELIGINSAKYADTQVEGMGYAIPVDTAEPILTDIANGRTPESTFKNEDGSVRLGVTIVQIDDQFRQSYPEMDDMEGVYVYQVEMGSPAEDAGVQSGDIITAIDDTKVTSVEDLQNALKSYQSGDSAELAISRMAKNSFGNNGFETGTLTVTFGAGEETQIAA